MTVAFSEVAKKPKDLFFFHSEAAPFYKWVATFCGSAASQSFNVHLRVSSLSASGHLHEAVTAGFCWLSAGITWGQGAN